MNLWTIRIPALLVTLLLSSCQTPTPLDADAIQLFAETSGASGHEWRLPQSGVAVVTESKPVVDARDVVATRVVTLDLGPALVVDLAPSGASQLAARAAHGASRLVLVSRGRALGIARLAAGASLTQISMFVEMPVGELNAWSSSLESRLEKGEGNGRR